MSSANTRRGFLGKICSIAGISFVPGAVVHAASLAPSKKIEFITHFPAPMTLQEYRSQKTNFENKDKVTTLISAFKKDGKMLSESFSFHGTHSVWRVEFRSEAHFTEWMQLTEEVGSHEDSRRELAGFKLNICDVT